MKKQPLFPSPFYVAPSWIFIVIGIMVGQTSLANVILLTVQNTVQHYLVPCYTTLVLVYLAYSAFRIPLEPFLNSIKFISKKAQLATPVPAEVRTVPIAPIAASLLVEDQPFDLSGAYKLRSNDNFDGFLAVQGVPWALRRAANQARPLHRITHQGNCLTIKIEGIIESQTTYIINGPPVETNVRGRIFEDCVSYLEDGTVGLIVRKKAITENYDVSVQRVLSQDMRRITMTSRATFRDGKEPVQCVQIFERVE